MKNWALNYFTDCTVCEVIQVTTFWPRKRSSSAQANMRTLCKIKEFTLSKSLHIRDAQGVRGLTVNVVA